MMICGMCGVWLVGDDYVFVWLCLCGVWIVDVG